MYCSSLGALRPMYLCGLKRYLEDVKFVYKQSLFSMSARPRRNAKPHPLRGARIMANKCTIERVKFIVLQQTIYNEGGSVAKSGVNTTHCTISAEV